MIGITMPHSDQQMIDAFRKLDRMLADGDDRGAESCCARIREIGAQSRSNLGPAWLADVIKNKGIRLPYLEHALKVDKVVVTGSVELEHGLLDALSGKKPFTIDRGTIELRITF
jgi:hypothetical protein